MLAKMLAFMAAVTVFMVLMVFLYDYSPTVGTLASILGIVGVGWIVYGMNDA